jgi:hypothetical protein
LVDGEGHTPHPAGKDSSDLSTANALLWLAGALRLQGRDVIRVCPPGPPRPAGSPSCTLVPMITSFAEADRAVSLSHWDSFVLCSFRHLRGRLASRFACVRQTYRQVLSVASSSFHLYYPPLISTARGHGGVVAKRAPYVQYPSVPPLGWLRLYTNVTAPAPHALAYPPDPLSLSNRNLIT